MIVTQIKQQKQNTARYSIYLDGEYFDSLDIDLLYELRLKEGMSIEKEELERLIDRLKYSKAYRLCLAVLSRSNKTENEIINKLKEKDFNEDIIERVLCKLKELDYINDEKYVEAWLRSKQGQSGINKKNIYTKLSQKGINKSLIEQKIGETVIDEYDSALRIAEKKARTVKGASKKEKKAKVFTFLYNKGYEMDICYKIIDNLNFEQDE